MHFNRYLISGSLLALQDSKLVDDGGKQEDEMREMKVLDDDDQICDHL